MCPACSGWLTSPCERHPYNVFPSFPLSSIASASSLPARGRSVVLLCGCASPLIFSPCSGSRTWHLCLLPSSTLRGTPAGGHLHGSPRSSDPGPVTKTHQSAGQAPVVPIPEVLGHPADPVTAYHLLLAASSPSTLMQSRAMVAYYMYLFFLFLVIKQI